MQLNNHFKNTNWLHKLQLLCGLVLLLLKTAAQQAVPDVVITARITDSAWHSIVAYASVTIQDSTGKTLSATLTNASGVFVLTAAGHRPWYIELSHLGYQAKRILVPATALKDTLELGELVLTALPVQLQSVTVTGRQQLVKQEIDRISYNVQADPDHHTQSVLELLVKVPLLSVDGDENIQLKGSGSFKVFINGKPSALTAKNPKDALKAMPAANVKKIEVITTPPAKYDAEGLTGIINIVLVKQNQDGYTASVSASYNAIVGLGQNFSATVKKNRLGISASGYVYEDLKRTNTLETERQVNPPSLSLLRQQGTHTYNSVFGSGTAEISYEIDTLQLLAASAAFYHSRDHNQSSQLTWLSNNLSNPAGAYHLFNRSYLKDHSLDVNVNYEKKFRRNKQQLLSFAYRLYQAPERLSNTIRNQPVDTSFLPADYLQQNNNQVSEHTLQADYSHPLKHLLLETGIKSILRKGASNFNDAAGNSALNDFRYRQNVYSVYQSYQFQSRLVNLKAGLRMEYTYVNTDFRNSGTHPVNRYLNWIPVFSIQHDFSNSAINMGYTQRIERPSIGQLNPFTDKSNPLFISSGNPLLQPVVQRNIELSYTSYARLNYHITGSYTFSRNTVQEVTRIADSLSFTTYQNIGSNKGLLVNTGFNYAFNSRLRVTTNINTGYTWLKGRYGKDDYSNKGITASGFISVNYSFNDQWRIASSLYTVNRTLTLQGESSGLLVHVLRLSKECFHKKGVLSIALLNPYHRFRYIRYTVRANDFSQQVAQQRNLRSFSINFNYRLGKLAGSLKKNQRVITNDDVNNQQKKNN